VKVACEIGEKRMVLFYIVAVNGGLFMNKKIKFLEVKECFIFK
jgi:hypothetical protein